LISENPAAKVPFLQLKSDGHEMWTDSDLEKFRTTWPLGTRERLAMELLYWTGLRRGDAVRLGKQHVKEGMIYLKAEKTGVALNIPVLPALAAVLDLGPTGDLAFIALANGQPMTKETFGNWFRGACNAAGVAGSAHGLRKAAATEAANAGASELELQSWFGWRNPTQSQTYTRKANAEKLAIAMGEKLSGNTHSRTHDQVREFPKNKPEKSRG
jgi:integrase